MIAALITEARTDPAFARQYLRAVRRAAPRPGSRDLQPGDRARRDPADTKIEVALDLLYGPVYHRLLHGHAPLNDRFVRDVVDTALDGIAPGTAARAPAPAG